MTEKSCADYFAVALKRKSPADLALKEYLDSGSMESLNKLQTYNGLDRSMLKSAVAENGASDVSRAVIDISLKRIAIYNFTREDRIASDFLRFSIADSGESAGMDEEILRYLKDEGESDVDIALKLVSLACTFGHEFFAWTKSSPFMSHFLTDSCPFEIPDKLPESNAIEKHILALSDDDAIAFLDSLPTRLVAVVNVAWNNHLCYLTWGVGPLYGVFASQRPGVMKKFIASVPMTDLHESVDLRFVVGATDVFDKQCIQSCELTGNVYPVGVLDTLRDGKYRDKTLELCMKAPIEDIQPALKFLNRYSPDKYFLKKLNDTVLDPVFDKHNGHRFFHTAALHWDAGGAEIFEKLDKAPQYDLNPRTGDALQAAIGVSSDNPEAAVWINNLLTRQDNPTGDADFYWKATCTRAPQTIKDKLWRMLGDKRKRSREFAVQMLIGKPAFARVKQVEDKEPLFDNLVEKATPLLKEKSADIRLGAIELLRHYKEPATVEAFKAALGEKQVKKVEEELRRHLTFWDEELPAVAPRATTKRKPKPLKLPAAVANWFDIDNLPDLHKKDQSVVPKDELLAMVVAQIKFKTVGAAPDNHDLFAEIDKHESGPFALAVLNQWLASDQKASDVWALALTGLLGDQKVLPVLTDRIPKWADSSRHKLAEYAACAVALVPANESLMILDSLANRYKSRYRNIGKACRNALLTAAQQQNISLDELSDMIVPTLEFDTNYQRALPDTDIVAVLQPDFKISFYNPGTEKETKTAPKSLPDTAVEELKTVKKLIRETIKGQTIRLENCLVQQRQWATARWQELFEANPFLQSYAARLVWCTVDAKGKPLQQFRRYTNGLLADANGDLIELTKKDKAVVIIHPLAMQDEQITQWREHFKRQKIKPPFEQLDRSTVILEKSKGNRKLIEVLEADHYIACGTFRSRAEKRGWVRGSVVDGGGVTYYEKDFSGVVSAILYVEDHWVGQDPMDMIKLVQALFVKGGSVASGSYTYDEPKNTDDPRVIALGKIPAMIYSEAMGDLKAISG